MMGFPEPVSVGAVVTAPGVHVHRVPPASVKVLPAGAMNDTVTPEAAGIPVAPNTE
jgi:hypothetical protein